MAENNSNNSSDWHLNVNNITNTSIGITTMSNSAPILDSFCPPIWDQSSNMNTMLREAMFVPTAPMMVPPTLPPFPADSAFIQRAARFSCFNGGNFSEMVNPFTSSHPDESWTFKNEKKIEQFTQSPDEDKNGVDGSDNQCEEAEFSGKEEISGKGLGLNKRKRIEYKENNGETAKETDEKQTGHPNPFSNGNRKPGSNPPKEEYIHVRARRGQATNSHSLAERVRREKISERMKFLQDIVPGCGKVTGKAVMLDEIINYVQSLQRQVEFLSMKLATVNPQLDVNMETFLSKDTLQARASTLAFPPDMTMSYPPQHGIIQASLSGMRTSSEALLRQPNSQHMQAHNVWADELHDIFHNGFNSSSPNAQDLSVSLPPGQSKTEL